MSELTNRLDDATAIAGKSIRDLWNRLGDSCPFEDRVLIAEEFLVYRANRARTRGMIEAAADYIFCHHGAVSVAELANRGSIGLRQLEREFRRAGGRYPKSLCSRCPVSGGAGCVAAPTRTWIDIAHSFSYYDQMDMIHDFEMLGLNSPECVVNQLGDSRPPALAPAENRQTATIAFLLGEASQLVLEKL